MKQFLLWIVVFMIAFSAKAQLKPEAMTLPITFTGISSAEERAILQNHVINELSVNYDLKSEKEVEQARDVAVDKISSENCTEEACIKQMGELLDVEHTFTFRIIAAGNYWDLSAIRLDLMGTTVRRNIACEQCNLSRARLLLTELIVGLRPGTTTVKRGEAVLQLESEPRSLVFLEGVEQGNTPLVLTVPTDRPAEILAVAEGYQDYSNLFELKSGELRKIKIPLVHRRGSFEITSEPSGASIILDGKQLTSSGGHPLHTPSTIRPVYGEHNLTLKFEKHQNLETEIKINRPNLGTKNYILKPNPGRLIVRVPSEFKDADLIINGREIGDMGGKIAKGFEVNANVPLKVQAKQGDFESDVESVEVGPEEIRKLEFNEFTDLRLVELRKEYEMVCEYGICSTPLRGDRQEEEERKELRDRLDRLEAERKRKVQTEKMKKLFKNTRVEIRTYRHLLDGAAYSLYFYFDPRFAIGYFHETRNNESGPNKLTAEHAGYVMRVRFFRSSTRMGTRETGWREKTTSHHKYLEDAPGFSLFSSSGKMTTISGRSSKIKPSGGSIDYVWYWENGISLLFGLGYASYNAEEDWSNNWENFEETSLFSWGLLNIGYMF